MANIICDRAFARLGIRITARERAEEVKRELSECLRAGAPKTVEINLREFDPAEAWSTDPHSPQNRWAFSAIEKALEKGFGRKAVYIGCGATIPFIKPFEEGLKACVLSIGVEDPYSLAHGENESLLLSDFYKAINSEIALFESLSQGWPARGSLGG